MVRLVINAVTAERSVAKKVDDVALVTFADVEYRLVAVRLVADAVLRTV